MIIITLHKYNKHYNALSAIVLNKVVHLSDVY